MMGKTGSWPIGDLEFSITKVACRWMLVSEFKPINAPFGLTYFFFIKNDFNYNIKFSCYMYTTNGEYNSSYIVYECFNIATAGQVKQ